MYVNYGHCTSRVRLILHSATRIGYNNTERCSTDTCELKLNRVLTNQKVPPTLCNESCIDRCTRATLSVVEHSTTTVARRRLWHRTQNTSTTIRTHTQRLHNSTGRYAGVLCIIANRPVVTIALYLLVEISKMLKDKRCGVTSLGMLRREHYHVLRAKTRPFKIILFYYVYIHKHTYSRWYK